ncbi:MAG: ROK family transcriptional regulator [Brachybacterium sp.]|uniref:ROK family protein n=1 Tax=Brachybacterium sp. TaxID=1891286 RepID=UPI00264854BA|nr:ROK family protein [Brachybacterium sp.]MDN5686441.1 ROK family transcriptional regulator [Brachybacterium sp.]
MPSDVTHSPKTSEASRRALALIVDGTVSSRADLRTQLGISASTASSLVRRLLDTGVIEEVVDGPSTGGRRPARLQVIQNDAAWLVAELGGGHLRLGVSTAQSTLLRVRECRLDIADGPAATFTALRENWEQLLEDLPELQILSAAIALPGPVSAQTNELIAPARMPGWHGVRIVDELQEALNIPVHVENDARAAALGEFIARQESIPDLIYVKAGTGIGAGLISRGQLIHGGSGVAGDITHVPVPGAEGRQCSCGRTGCLETVASGAAIRRELVDQELEVSSIRDVIDLAVTFQPAATTAVRRSGKQLGTALSSLVNFLNPSAVIIGGALSGVDAYVAAVRSAIYDSSLAMTTQHLLIETTTAGSDAALIGLTRIARRSAPLPVPHDSATRSASAPPSTIHRPAGGTPT